jgi:hypothetical protein
MNSYTIQTLRNEQRYYNNLRHCDKMIINGNVCIMAHISYSKSVRKNGFRSYHFMGIDEFGDKHETLLVYQK